MKPKYLFAPLLAGAVAFSSCKEKAKEEANNDSPAPADKVEPSDPAPKPQPLKSTAGVADRAAKLGFAKHLPKNLVSYHGIYNGRKAFDEFLKSPMGAFILERMADEGMDLDDVMGNDEMAMQIAAYSEEYFAAYGDGAGETFSLAMRLLERAAFYGSRTGIFAADAQVRDGRFNPDSPEVLFDGPLKGGVKELLEVFGKFDVPPYYQGSKISDADMRDQYATQLEQGISSFFGFMDSEVNEAITIKRGESELSGYKLIGAKLVEMLKEEDDLSEMEEVFGKEDVSSFMATLAKKDLVVASGIVGDYVLVFVGNSEEDFVLVENPEDSLCANEKMAYVDGYLGKNILTVGFNDGEAFEDVSSVAQVAYRIISAAAEGVSSGLGDASSLGDTSDVEALLESLSSQGKALASMFSVTDAGYLCYLEDGIKVEGWGGTNAPYLDSSKSHTFSSMGSGEGTLLFSNWTNNEAYNKKVMEYMDTLGETGYLVANRIAALDIDDGDFREFKSGIELFDSRFRADALNIWKALRLDLSEGLGSESAIVVDVNGLFPKVPLPEAILSEGKVPRIAYVSEVSNRAKLQESWGRMNTSIENILKTISEMNGEEIPMQVPMSSEKNDLKTWFVPIPFQNDDFVPSVSVSDKLFFVSTSKTFSESLTERYTQGGGEVRKGAWLHVNFEVFNTYAQQWFKLIEANAEEVIPNESNRDDFMANRDKIQQALKVLETLKKMTLHTRDEEGRLRMSMHLQAN